MQHAATIPPFANEPFDPPDVWAECRAHLYVLLQSFATPQDLLERQAVTVVFRKDLLRWLRPLEYVVRLLLFVMAKTIELSPLRTRTKQQTQRTQRAFNPSFRWPRKRTERKPSAPTEKEPRRWDPVVVESKALAERLEGLARVIENPERAAKRLARRMQKHPEEAKHPPILDEKLPDPESTTPLRHLIFPGHRFVRALYPREGDPPPSDDSS